MFLRPNCPLVKRNPLKWCFATSILLVGLILPNLTFAFLPSNNDNIDFETSEGYSAGDLNGQNNWNGDTNFDVSTAQHRSGFQGVIMVGSSIANIVASGTPFNSSAGGYAFYNFSLKNYNPSLGNAQLLFRSSAGFNGVGTWGWSGHSYDRLIIENAYKFKCSDKSSLGSESRQYLTPDSFSYYNSNGLEQNKWTDIRLWFDLNNKLIHLSYKQEGMTDYFDFSSANDLCWWANSGFSDVDFFDILKLQGQLNWAFDYLNNSAPPTMGSVTISEPPSNSDITQSFDFKGTYDKQGGDYNKIMVILEQWNASTTCPTSTEAIEQEKNQGWFLYQSLPFFSNDLLLDTGNFTGEYPNNVNDLRTGYYNCVRCYFINEISGIISDEQCRGYKLNIVENLTPYLPSYTFPFQGWDNYYSGHSDKYPSSTPLFSAMAETLSPLADRVGNFVVYVKTYFDVEQASAKGTALGQAIPIARGYLTEINNFFGGLPISDFVIFYLLSVAVIICYKIIYRVIRLIKP